MGLSGNPLSLERIQAGPAGILQGNPWKVFNGVFQDFLFIG
jgi:hypothetical protein